MTNSDDLPQGTLTSASLRQALLDVVRERSPDLERPTGDKATLLRAVFQREGAAAVSMVGRLALLRVPSTPVWAALAAGPTGGDVLARWQRLERFGHTRHRTRRLREDASSVLLEHYALDGGPIDPLHDLFIWGALVGLLERSGFTGVGLTLRDGPFPIYPRAPGFAAQDALRDSHRAILTWSSRASGGVSSAALGETLAVSRKEPSSAASLRQRVVAVFERDLLRLWRLREVARALGVSTRTLQRELTTEGACFSELLQRTRVVAAQRLLSLGAASITEVAFATGFSDLAHFSRCFRRHMEIPPSAYVELVRSTYAQLR